MLVVEDAARSGPVVRFMIEEYEYFFETPGDLGNSIVAAEQDEAEPEVEIEPVSAIQPQYPKVTHRELPAPPSKSAANEEEPETDGENEVEQSQSQYQSVDQVCIVYHICYM